MTAAEPAALAFEGLSFAYPADKGAAYDAPVLANVDFSVPKGAFVLLAGGTGSGKSTLLRLAKPEVAPHGRLTGSVLVGGREASALTVGESAAAIGFVQQDFDASFVSSDVARELAFGLECLGTPPAAMATRVAELACYLGIDALADRPLWELSGGQRQTVALGAAMAPCPALLLLDEPTASLDPIAEQRFLHALFRLNRELGVTVVVATHRPRPMAPYATGAFLLEGGSVRTVPLDDLMARGGALHVPPRATAHGNVVAPGSTAASGNAALSLKNLWLRYGRREPWVLKGASMELGEGEVRALVGGNGAGKTTLLKAAAGLLRPERGRLHNPLRNSQAYLPQDPRTLLDRETVGETLMGWSGTGVYGEAEARAMLVSLGLEGSWDRCPQDLSGGQQRLVALARLLLLSPRLLVADEPTSGLDDKGRLWVACRLRELADKGSAILVATHDLAFARDACDTVTLVFGGRAATTAPAAGFFDEAVFLRP